MSTPATLSRFLIAALLCAAIAGCGASSSSSSSAGSSSSSSTATQAAPPASTTPSPSVTSGPVHGALRAAGHTPVAGHPWPYSVHVTDANGKPLSGTVDIEFAFNGSVVGHDTPPTHALTEGAWQDKLTFPSTALGYPLVFQAVVHTSAGSVTLGWPVTVHP